MNRSGSICQVSHPSKTVPTARRKASRPRRVPGSTAPRGLTYSISVSKRWAGPADRRVPKPHRRYAQRRRSPPTSPAKHLAGGEAWRGPTGSPCPSPARRRACPRPDHLSACPRPAPFELVLSLPATDPVLARETLDLSCLAALRSRRHPEFRRECRGQRYRRSSRCAPRSDRAQARRRGRVVAPRRLRRELSHPTAPPQT
jgi:hypothetical protein